MSHTVDHEGPPRDRSREAGHDGAMFRPGRGRVFLRPEEPPERTPSGLHLPQTINHERDAIHFGTVLAVGAPAQERYLDAAGKLHVWDVPPEYKVGDRVLYVYAVALKRVRHFDSLCVCAQEEIQGVIEP